MKVGGGQLGKRRGQRKWEGDKEWVRIQHIYVYETLKNKAEKKVNELSGLCISISSLLCKMVRKSQPQSERETSGYSHSQTATCAAAAAAAAAPLA